MAAERLCLCGDGIENNAVEIAREREREVVLYRNDDENDEVAREQRREANIQQCP